MSNTVQIQPCSQLKSLSGNSVQTGLEALQKYSTWRYMEASSWPDFHKHKISTSPAELMKGSQIGVEGKRESRKQEDRKEKSRTHRTVLKTFQNTWEYKQSIKWAKWQTRTVCDFKEKYLQTLECSAVKWKIFVPWYYYEGIQFVIWSLTVAVLCAWKMTNFIIFRKMQGREGHDPAIINFI